MLFDLVGEETVLGYIVFPFALQPDNHMAGTSAFVEFDFLDAETPSDKCLTDEFLRKVDIVDHKSSYLCHCT